MIDSKVFVNSSVNVGYPKLMRGVGSNVVVLMTSDCCGVVVREGDGVYKIGEHYEDWAMNTFEDFEGELVLKNR